MATTKPFSFSKSFLSFYRFLWRKLAGKHHRRAANPGLQKFVPPPEEILQNQTLVVDVEGWLLRSSSTFHYFMLVVLEAGSYLRGLLLLLLYPLLCFLSNEMRLRVMVMVSFFGMREEELKRAGRAVLPKLFLEEVAKEGFEVVKKGKKVVGVSRLPRVMVEVVLRDYLGVDVVVGTEVKKAGKYYLGLMAEEEEEESLRLKWKGILFGEGKEEKGQRDFSVLGFAGKRSTAKDHILFSYCKVSFVVD